jgi:hypothetical protein
MYELFPHQDDFLYSDKIHTGLVGGFGCGKSFIGVLKTVSKKLQYPGINVAYYLPTHSLIKDIAFPKFSEVLTAHNVSFELHETDKEFKTQFGKIILRTTSNPEMIVGYEVGYSLIDEADIPPLKKMKQAFTNIVARNRAVLPDGSANKTDFVSTPEGFKFLYEFFVKKNNSNKLLIKGKTSANKKLPPTYIETLKESYTDQQLDAYLNGEFVNLTAGTVHHTFDRFENHSDREIKPNDKLHIGMDFNIGNMHGIIHVMDGRTPIAVDEIVNAFDTADIINKIKTRFPDHRIIVYPDASGASRKTSSSKSDIQLLKAARFVVKNPSKNPAIRDRVNVMNAAFLNAKGERSYFVNTHNCPTYTEALEKQAYKNGEPDKTSGFDHPNEAAGYFIYQIKRNSSRTIIV